MLCGYRRLYRVCNDSTHSLTFCLVSVRSKSAFDLHLTKCQMLCWGCLLKLFLFSFSLRYLQHWREFTFHLLFSGCCKRQTKLFYFLNANFHFILKKSKTKSQREEDNKASLCNDNVMRFMYSFRNDKLNMEYRKQLFRCHSARQSYYVLFDSAQMFGHKYLDIL